MDAFIEQRRINEFLDACGTNMMIREWTPISPEQLQDYVNPKCLQRYVEPGLNTKVVAVVDKTTNEPVSFLSYQFIWTEDETTGEADNTVFIKYSCTENNYTGRGLSKLLHYLVILYAMTQQMMSATAYVIDPTEEVIFKSFGGTPLSQQDVDENGLLEQFKVPINYIIPFDNTVELPRQIGLIAAQIQECERPVRA